MKNWTYQNFTIHQFEQLDSTNDAAFVRAENREIFDREIILAEMQSGGKGRESRSWDSPKGNLYFSLLLQPPIEIKKIPQISFVAITALRLAVAELEPEGRVENKWPNDLLINKKKVAGLLLESKIAQQNCQFVIVGIGLNLVSNPDKTIFPASNLKNFSSIISAPEMLKKFLNQFEKIYQNWLDFGFEGIRELWLQSAFRLGQEVAVKNNGAEIVGTFSDLDEEGNLVLETKNDGKKIIFAADLYSA